ncbi:MAG: hypothetical protein KC897_03520 [Candidatus Omnitrophica bacterium]|nr:hypothetical protein [Candidatus Omnitrophota bacterium]MCB9720411.1 hypothetical protein [Candidatus Omnitrophota bacterium]
MKTAWTMTGVLIMMAVLGGCSLADLRTGYVLTGTESQLAKEGRRLLELAVWRQDKSGRWDDFDAWTIETTDIWETGLIRRFTPLTANRQDIVFRFELDRSAAAMTFGDGRRAGEMLGVDESGQFTERDARRTYAPVKKLSNYLEPVRDYFFWPQSLVNYPTVLYAGADKLEGAEYHKIFVSGGEAEPSRTADQYVVWLNKANLRIDYIEFTLRSLLKSYRGVVRYSDYRPVEGISLPHRLTLLDRIGGRKYSHEFVVRGMSFTLPPRELGFAVEIRPFSLNLGLN